MKACAIILAAGSGTRMGTTQSKTLLKIDGIPAIKMAVDAFLGLCEHIYLAVRESEKAAFKELFSGYPISFVEGGDTRRKSVENCLYFIDEKFDTVLIHDGARPFVSKELIKKVLKGTDEFSACIPAVKVSDTVKKCVDNKVVETIDREKLYLVQTPQGFKTELVKKAYEEFKDDTSDDEALIAKLGHKVHVVEGEKSNVKLTYMEDYNLLSAREPSVRMGIGYDVHKLVENRKLILCGVEIPYEKGLLGHSDADVALHAVSDALLGALALGDIGRHFPDNDPKYKDANSAELLSNIIEKLENLGFNPYNVDITIVAQKPKLVGYMPQMQKRLADILKIDVSNVSVKASTTEGLGFEGRQEGISAYAVATVYKKNER